MPGHVVFAARVTTMGTVASDYTYHHTAWRCDRQIKPTKSHQRPEGLFASEDPRKPKSVRWYYKKERKQPPTITPPSRCRSIHQRLHEVLPHHHAVITTTIYIAILLCNLDHIAIGNIVRIIIISIQVLFTTMFSIADMIAMCELSTQAKGLRPSLAAMCKLLFMGN